ncbi:MAG TPA: hypothetical protein VNN17_05505 [Terriglobia bacterium]|nr:hypothetical protein [Terriglobia bacterium]
MLLEEKKSHLMLFGALLLKRSGKASLAQALRIAPLTNRTRRLANLLTAVSSTLPEPAISTTGYGGRQ